MLLFYITYPDKKTCEQISKQAVEAKLAACTNMFPINNVYFWENKLEEEQEWVGILKTSDHLEDKLASFIEEIHPYDVPCIIRYSVDANKSFEDWILQSVKEL